MKSSGLCQGCGSELPAMKRKGNPRKWCSESCRVRNYRKNNPDYVERMSEQAKARAAEREAAKPPKPRCESCGGELWARREGIRFFGSPECRLASYRALKEGAGECSEKGCDRPSHARGLCGAHYSIQWGRKFPGKSRQIKSRYRARKRDAFVEDVDPAVVMERDKWRCHLCGEKIPKNVAYPDPKSPSVDHVIPLARGGKHEMSNAAASHLICNVKKRDRGEGEQLMLIG